METAQLLFQFFWRPLTGNRISRGEVTVNAVAPRDPRRTGANTLDVRPENGTPAREIDHDGLPFPLERRLRQLFAEQREQRQQQEQDIQQVEDAQQADIEVSAVATRNFTADVSEQNQVQRQDTNSNPNVYEESSSVVSSTMQNGDGSIPNTRLSFIRGYFGRGNLYDNSESDSSSEGGNDVESDEDEDYHPTFAYYFMRTDFAAEERARQEERRQTRLECERLRLALGWYDDDDDDDDDDNEDDEDDKDDDKEKEEKKKKEEEEEAAVAVEEER